MANGGVLASPDRRARVPDAVRHPLCRSAEPGPYEAPACVTVPALRSSVKNAAARPGHGIDASVMGRTQRRRVSMAALLGDPRMYRSRPFRPILLAVIAAGISAAALAQS